jgi:hypothetical protein
MGNENLITDKIYRQIIAIRDSGACNMFDLPRVQEEAYKMGFYELVVFLNEFPYPSIRCNNLLGIVIISAGFNPPSKKSCCSFCRLFSCNPRQFYLDSKSRCKHCAFSSLSLCFLPFGSVH